MNVKETKVSVVTIKWKLSAWSIRSFGGKDVIGSSRMLNIREAEYGGKKCQRTYQQEWIHHLIRCGLGILCVIEGLRKYWDRPRGYPFPQKKVRLITCRTTNCNKTMQSQSRTCFMSIAIWSIGIFVCMSGQSECSGWGQNHFLWILHTVVKTILGVGKEPCKSGMNRGIEKMLSLHIDEVMEWDGVIEAHHHRSLDYPPKYSKTEWCRFRWRSMELFLDSQVTRKRQTQ